MARRSSWRETIAKHTRSDVKTPEQQAGDERLDGGSFRAFIWILFAFKMETVAAVVWAAGDSSEAWILLSATTWPWLIIPGIVIFGWLTFRLRLRRARARRIELQRSEWMVDEQTVLDPARQASDTNG